MLLSCLCPHCIRSKADDKFTNALQGHKAGEHIAGRDTAAAKREDLRFWVQQERVCGLAAQDRQRHTRLHCARGPHGRPV